jgi:hypothetical protein
LELLFSRVVLLRRCVFFPFTAAGVNLDLEMAFLGYRIYTFGIS